jgi:iron complex outermembrane receptor protein
VREEWRVRPALQVTADLAWRRQGYHMRGDRFDGIRFDQPYDFAVPRLGLTWTPRSELTVFGAWARSRREPAFRDLFDAEGVGSVPLFVNGEPILEPETVNDWELGGAWRSTAWSVAANLFRMDFEDELVFGTFNTDLGYAFIGNAARSVHQGVELAGRAELEPAGGFGLTLEGNATLSDNHFIEYREPDGSALYDDNTIGFFPSVIGNATARLAVGRAALALDMQHAGRIYLDHSESRAASIDPRTVFHLRGSYGVGLAGEANLQLGVRVFNLFDEEYETGGYTYAGVPYFIPAATRHALAELRVDF